MAVTDPEVIKPDSEKVEHRDFEDILNIVGGWGRYQYILLSFFVLQCVFLTYATFTPILFLYVPDDHYCDVSHWLQMPDVQDQFTQEELLELMIPKNVDGSRSKCSIYQGTPQEIRDVQNASSQPISACLHGWDYNSTDFYHSAATQMEWVCDDAWRGPFTQAMFSLGAIVGTLIFGYVADHWGRFASFYGCTVILMVGGLLTPIFGEFVGFSIIRFVQGLSFDTFFTMFYVLALEYVEPEKRALIGNLALAVGIGFAGSVQPWILYFLRDWETFNMILYIQVTLVFVTPWFVFESVRWLSTQGRQEEAHIIIQKIATINGKDLSSRELVTIQEILAYEQQATQSDHSGGASILDLFRTPHLRKNFIIMTLVYGLSAHLFEATIRIISIFEQSIFITFSISCFLEFPADLLTIWGLDWIGRRWSVFISLILAGILNFSIILFLHVPIVVTTLSLASRFLATYAYNTAINISMEIVPTVVRGQGVAFAKVFCHLAVMLAPFVVYLDIYAKFLPYLVIGCTCLITCILALILPETAGENLPDSLDDGKDFGKHQGFWHIPCILEMQSRKTPLEAVESQMTIVDSTDNQVTSVP